MSDDSILASPDMRIIAVSDICGLWEVIRINRGDKDPVYPWIKGRFKFNLLEEMMFLLLKDGQHSHGNWELIMHHIGINKHYLIILDDMFKYEIVDIDETEMILSDGANKFLLTRRL